jgi:ubiquinone/menaquinone biosynthesis C-methylase UbiE
MSATASAPDPLHAPPALIERLRCPETFRHGFVVHDAHQLRCTGSGRLYAVRDGYVDMVWHAATPTPAQWLMETGFYSQGYETWFRPALTSLVTTQPIDASVRLSLSMLAPLGGCTVLDVGCGTGNFTRALAEEVRRGSGPTPGFTVGLDLSAPMLRVAAQHRDRMRWPGLAWVRGDAQSLPFVDGCFDAVHTSAALQLVDDPNRAVAEMARVVRPGGRVLVNTFVRSSFGITRRIQQVMGTTSGFTWFTPDRLMAMLQSNGLRVTEEVIEGAAISLVATREVR